MRSVHDAYFAAGADIATTNTFTATSIGQADYGLEDAVYELNVAGARIAREAAGPDRFVAGSVGPLNITLSLSPRVDDPGYRTHTFDQVVETYAEQIRGLADGGVDLLLIETIFDTLNAKAAIVAAREVAPQLPLWISVTIVDLSGRTLSGQTIEAFWTSIEHADPLIVGVNCSLGAREMRPYVAELSRIATCLTSAHPNAGPAERVRRLRRDARRHLGAPARVRARRLPERRRLLLRLDARAHARHLRAVTRGLAPRVMSRRGGRAPRFSGLEPFEIGPDTGFVLIGERTNVTGSARFRRLIEGGDFNGAVDVALEQVRGGANLLDVNMDADLLEGEEAMRTFLNVIATEPEVARLPIMVDSSKWTRARGRPAVPAGQGHRQLDLAEGRRGGVPAPGAPRPRLRRRRDRDGVRRGGPGDRGRPPRRDLRARVRPARRTTSASAPEDIVFDPNVLAVATGIEEHNDYARAFIEALPKIKERCPGARTSGGISNLSFSFRGNDRVREAMHAAFLYHAIRAGLDMGIVNAGQLAVYEDIEPELLECVEDVIFNRRDDATERLVELADRVRGDGHEARARPELARGARREAARARARARHRRLRRGRHRGGAPRARSGRST